MNRFVLALPTVLAVAVTITVPAELRGQPTRPASANHEATSERTHLTGPPSLPRPDSLPEAEVPCLFTQATTQSQAEMDRWPSLSLGGAAVGWGGTVQRPGFELRARIERAPVRLGLVWGRAGTGSFTTGWSGVELTATAAHLLGGELGLGVAAGSHSEKNSVVGAGGALVRISDRDWTLGPRMSLTWTVDRPMADSEVEAFLRWGVGLGDEKRYHVPALGLSLGLPIVESGFPVLEPIQPRMSLHAAAGIAPGTLRLRSGLVPLARAGVDVLIGNVITRAFADMEFDGNRSAHSFGTALLLTLPGRGRTTLHAGAALRRYVQTVDDLTNYTWISGPMVEVRRRLGDRLSLAVTADRSWGFDTTGEGFRIDGLTFGLRR
jgi:hypothetical protein